MQAKAITFKTVSLDPSQKSTDPGLTIWCSLYHELRAAGYSKQQIATLVDLSPRSIDRLLTGFIKQPSYKVLSRMLQAYCCYSLKKGGDDE